MMKEKTENQDEYESAEVVAVFWTRRGRDRKVKRVPKVSPLRFIRSPRFPSRIREHRIVRIISTAKLYDGIYPIVHFHVEDRSGTHFHLVYDSKCFTWKVRLQD